MRWVTWDVPIPTRKEALDLARRSPGIAGICAQCGCTPLNACRGLGFMEEENCAWANRERTLCTNPRCLAKAAAEAKRA